MNKLMLVFGTRPELIKVVPVIREFKRRGLRDKLLVVRTGQHTDLIDFDIRYFGVTPDYSLTLTRNEAGLSNLVGHLLLNFNQLSTQLKREKITVEGVIAQGDTASTYCSAIHAFHENLPFYHIEAGCRTFDNQHPFPEEYYRSAIASITRFHYAPTEVEKCNLEREGIDKKKILVTGNTVIDLLKSHVNIAPNQSKKQVVISLHRRELLSNRKQAYLNYFYELAKKNVDWKFLWLTHPSMKLDKSNLKKLPNFYFTSPLPYAKLMQVYQNTTIVYTDSGGIQEETGYLGIPCIVARNTTERRQGVAEGAARFINLKNLCLQTELNLFAKEKLRFQNPIYGFGNSAELIANSILETCNNYAVI